MADQISGTLVGSIDRAIVTGDGAHMLLTYKRADGEPQALAIPVEQLRGLLTLISQSVSSAGEKRGRPADQRDAVVAESWKLEESPDKRLVMTIRLNGGGDLSFILPAKSLQEVYSVEELLKRAAGKTEPSTTRH